MTEKALEQLLRKGIISSGGLCIKFTSPGMKGVPDRIIILPGKRIYFVELKSGIGVLSKIQIIVHELFKGFGWPVYVIANKEQLQDFLNAVL